MMVIFIDLEGRCIKTWCGEELAENVLPLPGDHVILVSGDGDEVEEYVVKYRTFRGVRQVYVTVDVLSD